MEIAGLDNLSDVDFDEQDLLDREALTEPYRRLGCQARVLGDVIVQVPEEKWDKTSLDQSQEVESSSQ